MTRRDGVSTVALFFAMFALLVPLSRAAEHRIAANDEDIVIRPIQHAGFVMSWNSATLYVDPYGDALLFEGAAGPDLILITDVHADHTDVDALKLLATANTKIVAPSAVAAKLPSELAAAVVALANGETRKVQGVEITAVPMYNMYEQKSLHPKGRGNGYVVELGGKRIYVSGDTDDIPEMRELEDIDIAFLCMIPPFTMSVDQAADAVSAFRPKVVFPYHYQDSDVQRFKALVERNVPGTQVKLDNWYPHGM